MEEEWIQKDPMMYSLFGTFIILCQRLCRREESLGGEHFEALLYVPFNVSGVTLACDHGRL